MEIIGGDDFEKFQINGTDLHFIEAPDYERPSARYEPRGIYEVLLASLDGLYYELLKVEIINVPEPPVFTCCDRATVVEGKTYVTTMSAYDPEDGEITYLIFNGGEYEYFRIDRQSGELTLRDPIDFEVGPLSLEVVVSAFDGESTTLQNVEVTIVNLNEAPFITSSLAVEYLESSTEDIITVK